MKAAYKLRPKAQKDVGIIWDYCVARWGADQAETYIRRLWRDIQDIAENAGLGQDCSQIRENYRKYLSGSHLIFYRILPQGIEIVRILHVRMDFDQHL